jgi:hypothetical protein
VKRIHVFSNKGSGPLQRGDIHRNAKIWWDHLKTAWAREILCLFKNFLKYCNLELMSQES